MDDDLRSLERRAATDPTLQPLLRRARERAGLGRSLELRSVEADELHEAVAAGQRALGRLREGRRAHAEAMAHGLRSWVSGAFTDHPGLHELTVSWRLHERRDGPWTVGLGVEVPLRDRRRPPQRRNTLLPESARELEGELLRFASLLPSRHELFAAVRLWRDRDRSGRWFVVVDTPPRRDMAGLELEVPLLRVEALARGRTHDPHGPLGPSLRAGVGTRAGAQRIADGATADLADDTAEYLLAAGEAWDHFLSALFADHRDLELFVVRGWTSGYNDNWYDEHDQEVCLAGEALADLPEEWGAPLPPEVVDAISRQAGPAGPALQALRTGLARDFEESVFGPFLRLRHGHDWLLVLRRDGDHVVERLLLRPEATP